MNLRKSLSQRQIPARVKSVYVSEVSAMRTKWYIAVAALAFLSLVARPAWEVSFAQGEYSLLEGAIDLHLHIDPDTSEITVVVTDPNDSYFDVDVERPITGPLVPPANRTRGGGRIFVTTEFGKVYELITETFPPNDVQDVLKTYGEAMPAREKIYPIAGIWHTDVGNQGCIRQIWMYKDWGHREEVMSALADANWPPKLPVAPLTRETRIMYPAAFSPLH